MGGGAWDPRAYSSAKASRAASGVDDFDYDNKVKTGRARGIHPDLDPKKLAGATSPVAGKPIRESRDSDEHPESLPIAVIFDVTGSMGGIPRVLQQKLTSLMDVVIAKADVKDPQVLVGAVGDYHSDQYPFQVGQFESDNRFDEQLRNIILEGNGGGQAMESYALAYRFAAYHTATDSFEKRGKKGYFFTMGDEAPWPTVTAGEVKDIFGVEADGDETVEELLAKAQETWEIYHLYCMDGSYPNSADIHEKWRKLLGERFVKIDDSSLVCEIIAGIVNMLETAKSVDLVVDDIGLKGTAAASVKNALVAVSKNRLPGKLASGTLPKAGTKKGGMTAL
jgi:hypothetical protein